jgi:hypothetical protein
LATIISDCCNVVNFDRNSFWKAGWREKLSGYRSCIGCWREERYEGADKKVLGFTGNIEEAWGMGRGKDANLNYEQQGQQR